VFTDHPEALVEFVEDTAFVEHLAAVSILVVVGDAKPQLARQLSTDDVLFHLLALTTSHALRVSANFHRDQLVVTSS